MRPLVLILFASPLLAGCAEPLKTQTKRSPKIVSTSPESDYLSLLAKFPEDDQALGIDPGFAGAREQPMTMGYVLSAESIRYRASPTPEGERRVGKGIQWLLDNKDLNGDGRLGWGLPDPFDAFADGSVNAKDQEYLVTNAIAMQGLLDALSTPLLTPSERDEALSVLKAVAEENAASFTFADLTHGFYWYSYSRNDAREVNNVNAYVLGVTARLLSEHPAIFTEAEAKDHGRRVAAAAATVVGNATYHVGYPFWRYMPGGKSEDLVHHVYTIHAMSVYESAGGKVPWTKRQAVEGLGLFWRANHLRHFPNNPFSAPPNESPTRLWGAGMALGVAGRSSQGDRILSQIRQEYGPFPDLAYAPPWFDPDAKFYPRYAAHVLYGLSRYAYHDPAV